MSRKHASWQTFCDLTHGTPLASLAKELRVHRRTAKAWRDGSLPIPWWVVNLLLLEAYAREDVRRQMLGRLAVMGLPTGAGNKLRKHLDLALSAALFEALELGLVRDAVTHVPRQPSIAPATAQRPSGLPVGRGLTTR